MYETEADITLAEKYSILAIAELQQFANRNLEVMRQELAAKQQDIAQQEKAVATMDEQLVAVWDEIVTRYNLHPDVPAKAYKVAADPGTRLTLVDTSLIPQGEEGAPDGGSDRGEEAPSGLKGSD